MVAFIEKYCAVGGLVTDGRRFKEVFISPCTIFLWYVTAFNITSELSSCVSDGQVQLKSCLSGKWYESDVIFVRCFTPNFNEAKLNLVSLYGDRNIRNGSRAWARVKGGDRDLSFGLEILNIYGLECTVLVQLSIFNAKKRKLFAPAAPLTFWFVSLRWKSKVWRTTCIVDSAWHQKPQ